MKMLPNKFFTIILIILCTLISFAQNQNSQSSLSELDYFNVVLNRPTDKSISISLLPLKKISFYCEYKKSSDTNYEKTETKSGFAGEPNVFVLNNLIPNTRYNYRILYSENASGSYISGDEHTFHTQRAKGNSFSFTIEADPHPYDKKGSHTLWDICFRNQLKDNPDFMFDLGDTFGDDHTPLTTTSNDMKQLHLDNRAHFGVATHSVPLFLCLGNHEGESGYYLLQTPPNNIGVTGTLWRKYYYPNPEPNDFYTGNNNVEQFGMGLPQNYYAYEWGDALFVVLDAYRYYTISAKPRNWEWTIGETQYNWFKQTLEKSSAKFKFVFIHHVLGESRGGVAVAKLNEWGGYSSKGVWEFDKMRPGWDMPIHQLMVKNKVNIFFQGHDHLFAKEELDGIVYQEVPMPSDSTYIIGTRDNGDAYPSPSVNIDASGHLRVTVSSASVTVDYVRAWLPKDETSQHKNGEVAYSYTVLPKTTAIDVEDQIPSEFELHQNYPNPFNPSTVISYQIPAAGHVSLKVFDTLGREVSTLVDEFKQPGNYSSIFTLSSSFSTGVYFYQLRSGSFNQSKKMIVVK